MCVDVPPGVFGLPFLWLGLSFSAPLPTMKMWSVFSMVMRAKLTGFLMSESRPVAPALRVLPSIMDASISMCLSIV